MFKVGDKVRVIKECYYEAGCEACRKWIGCIFTIKEVFNVGDEKDVGSIMVYVEEDESFDLFSDQLELINSDTTPLPLPG